MLMWPGGNITGLSIFTPELAAKRLELLKEAFPALTKAAVLLNPDNAIVLQTFEARRSSDFERVFTAMADQQVDALVVIEDTMLNANANALAVFAAVKRLPSCGFPEFVRAGGLLAYGINFPDMDYRAATFVDKILKGAHPGDLPVEQSTKFNMMVNLQTAKALSITLPPTLLARADEVIE